VQCAELHPSLCFWLCHEHSHEEEGYYDGISIFNPHEHAVMRVGMPGLKEQPTDRSNLARSRQLAIAQQRMVPQGTLYPRLQVKIIRHITKPYYSNILGTKRPPPVKSPQVKTLREIATACMRASVLTLSFHMRSTAFRCPHRSVIN